MHPARNRASFSLIRILGLLPVCVICLVTIAHGQVQTTSAITGTVTDPSGAIVVGATITIKNQDTGATRQTTTNVSGYYSFPSVLPGTYTVTARSPGFKEAVVTNRVVREIEGAIVDIVLQLGRVSEKVTVSAQGAELLTPSTAEINETVQSNLVTTIPLNRRDFFDLTSLVPGVFPGDTNTSYIAAIATTVVVGNVTAQSGANVGGNRDQNVNVSIDGANVQDEINQQTNARPSPSSIQELKVETAGGSAEFGSGAAAVQVVTKSGTNRFHGELYEFLRNNAMDANGFFNNLTGVKLAALRQNEFGIAVGGPILKDKLLFFTNYEGLRTQQMAQSYTNVPDMYVRNGDFSHYQPGTTGNFGPTPTIYNPFSYNATTGLRNPFPNNQIPKSSFDPAVAAYLNGGWIPPPTPRSTGFLNTWARPGHL
jgi:hypothetical protein